METRENQLEGCCFRQSYAPFGAIACRCVATRTRMDASSSDSRPRLIPVVASQLGRDGNDTLGKRLGSLYINFRYSLKPGGCSISTISFPCRQPMIPRKRRMPDRTDQSHIPRRFQLTQVYRLVLIAVTGLIALPGITPPSAGAVDLAKNGSTSFVIVTDTEPSLEENTAAQWLSETLEQA